MQVALTVVLTAAIGAGAVALGLYLNKRVIRVRDRLLGVPGLTPAQAAAKRKVLRAMGLYVLALLVVGATTWAATGNWVVAIVVVVAAMVVLQLGSLSARAFTYRRAGRDRHS